MLTKKDIPSQFHYLGSVVFFPHDRRNMLVCVDSYQHTLIKIPKSFFILVPLSFFLSNCANPGTLSGGPKDERPPQLDTVLSTPNLQTNFEKQTIELAFDEWIKLNKVFEQVVISPPVVPAPEITIKKRSVLIEFEEEVEFRENATYVINFGEAVQDLTESNPAEDLRFIFSTGDYIDSLEVSGTVKDALTDEAVENVLVMLYDNLADTVVRTEVPFYFARTDETGNFTISNVRADTFKVFALEENISNYLFDFANERIDFLDTFLVVNDSSVNRLDFKIFLEEPELEIKDINQDQYGLARIEFNQKPLDLMFKYEANFEDLYFDYEKDSLRIWYDLISRDSSQTEFILSKDSTLTDTLIFSAASRAEFVASDSIRLQKIPKSISQNPLRPLELLFNHPLLGFDSSLIQIYTDTTRTVVPIQLSIDSTSAHRKLMIQHDWIDSLTYELEILPNALTDIYDLSNPDTIMLPISILNPKEFGNINLALDSLDSLKQYLVTIKPEGSTIPIGEFTISEVTTWEQEFQAIKIGVYELEITIDANKNGKWDSGNYDLKTKPEKIIKQTLQELLAGFDLDSTVEVVDDP
ncbi:MAG: Ig-like domain-containing protein [Bacteroidota bacterium]